MGMDRDGTATELGQIQDRTRTEQDCDRSGMGLGQIQDRMGLGQIQDRTGTDLKQDGMGPGQDGMGGNVS